MMDKKSVDSDFQFWYPVIVEKQPDFEGHIHEKEILKEGHINYGGRLLCGESREVLKNRVKKEYEKQEVREKASKTRVDRTKICPACTAKYMKNGRSAYCAWVEGKPKVAATKELIVPQNPG
jgi:hypothetical protein